MKAAEELKKEVVDPEVGDSNPTLALTVNNEVGYGLCLSVTCWCYSMYMQHKYVRTRAHTHTRTRTRTQVDEYNEVKKKEGEGVREGGKEVHESQDDVISAKAPNAWPKVTKHIFNCFWGSSITRIFVGFYFLQ